MNTKIIGRDRERSLIGKAISLGRHILIEGPVGSGKTFLVRSLLEESERDFERIDGDTRYTEQKLTGWFDPPVVLKRGYVADAFIDGPLVVAMREGRALFINELNRMPEAVQNILLPAMDERTVVLPKLGEIRAKPGFVVLATQNPREFTATHSLSEALLDRFEMIALDYQSREEELEILEALLRQSPHPKLRQTPKRQPVTRQDLERIVDLVRATRDHGSVKRGASVRAAQAMGELLSTGMSLEEACRMALSTRIEFISSDEDLDAFLTGLLNHAKIPQKKKAL